MRDIDDVNNYLNELIEDLNSLEDRHSLLETLIEFGQELKQFDNDKIIIENKVPGCISQVYICVNLIDGKFYFKGYSGSQIVKGYIYILINALNGLNYGNLINNIRDLIENFVQKSQINSNFTASRSDAFANIYAFMIKKAISLKDKVKN